MTTEQDRQVRVEFERLSGLAAEVSQVELGRIADADVRGRVGRLLVAAANDSSGEQSTLTGFSQAAAMVDEATEDLPAGSEFGGYMIQYRLGEGGFGYVYKATERGAIDRDVALKVIKPGFDSKAIMARFEVERRLMSFMNHEHIAKVLNAGIVHNRPYFVMEYVPGTKVTQFADENHLSVEERLRLFQQICSALQHAHEKGVIHRDIKSSNVLGFMSDGRVFSKVIDFGIAKSLRGDRLTDLTVQQTGRVALGTYEAMSPEQALGAADIDQRTDVYSLGVLLYELLTGVKPFDEETIRRAAEEEIKRLIREVEPPRPSTRFSAMSAADSSRIAGARKSRVQALRRQLRSELEWIPLMAMGKARNSRYDSASAMSADIENYLTGQPINATKLARSKRRRIAIVAALVAIEIVAPFAVWFIIHTYFHGASTAPTESETTLTAIRDAEATMRQADGTEERQREKAGVVAAAYLSPLLEDLNQSDVRVWQVAGKAAIMSSDQTLSALTLEALTRLDPSGAESSVIMKTLMTQTSNTALDAWKSQRPKVVSAYNEAAKGVTSEMTKLGDFYWNGITGDMHADHAEANKWYIQAAKNNDAEAQKILRKQNVDW